MSNVSPFGTPTLGQIAALEAAYYAGVTSASYQGKSTTFRSLAEMRQVIADMKAAYLGTTPTRQLRIITRKAY